MTQDTLSPEQLFIVLRWDEAPVLVAAGEDWRQVEQLFPKARLVMSYPMLKLVVEKAQDAKVYEARPFGRNPTLHFCLTAKRGNHSIALVIKATSVNKAMRKARRVAGSRDITLMGSREELEHYLGQLDESLEQGKPLHIEADLRASASSQSSAEVQP